jgi:hypothetical protein
VEKVQQKKKKDCSAIDGWREDSEVVLVFEHNNIGLKKVCQVLSEQTSNLSALVNVTCPLNRVLNCERNFSYMDPDYPTPGLIVTGLARVCCIAFSV